MPGLNEVSRGRYVHFVDRLYMLYLNTIYSLVWLLRAKKGLKPMSSACALRCDGDQSTLNISPYISLNCNLYFTAMGTFAKGVTYGQKSVQSEAESDVRLLFYSYSVKSDCIKQTKVIKMCSVMIR